MAAEAVTQDEIRDYVRDNFEGVNITVAAEGDGSPEIAWGDTFFMHGDQQFPFATIVTKNYPDDTESGLDRDGVYRLNIGVGKETFAALVADEPADRAELDRVFAHPVYGRMHWICVVNPSRATFESLKPALSEAYGIAVGRGRRRSG